MPSARRSSRTVPVDYAKNIYYLMGYYHNGDDYLSGSFDQKLKYQTIALIVSKTCSNPEDRLHKNQKTKSNTSEYLDFCNE